jgi:hypothetical protein
MVSIKLKDKEIKFNLKSYAREIDLCQTITRLQLKNSQASIDLTTSYNEKLSLKVPEILDIKFNEAEYAKSEVHEKQEKPKEEDIVETLLKGRDAAKKRRIEKFVEVLRRKGTPINPNDPMLQDIIDKL